jgi:beta-lactamase superfamily II metal-dependent hydrolase
MSKVKSFSVGNGDMFYIDHNSDNFTIIDCCYSDEENKNSNFEEIRAIASKKVITRFISTHPDDDHIKGLKYLDDQMPILNFYCVKNEATKPINTDDFKRYCELRDNNDKHFYLFKGCSIKWMNIGDENRGSSGINCLWPNTSNEDYIDALEKAKEGKSYNNISPIITYSTGEGHKFMWMGDAIGDFIDKIQDEIDWPRIDILFAPHHGRDSGKLKENILKQINPQIIIIGEAESSNINYYQGYNTITQNSAGDVIFICSGSGIDIFVSKSNYSVSFLTNKNKKDLDGNHYIGTLNI